MPRPRPALELFLSLGVTAGVLATAISAPPALPQHQHHGTDLSVQGGEGGEGGEASHAAAVQSNLDVLVVLAQIEYQDARGFLLEAQRLLARAIAGQPGATTELMARQSTVTAMLMAFPTVMPPQKAVVSVAQLQQLQKEL
jgi:hypothetical protein